MSPLTHHRWINPRHNIVNHLYDCRNCSVVFVWHTAVCEAFLSYTIVLQYSLSSTHRLGQGLCDTVLRPVFSRRRKKRKGRYTCPIVLGLLHSMKDYQLLCGKKKKCFPLGFKDYMHRYKLVIYYNQLKRLIFNVAKYRG